MFETHKITKVLLADDGADDREILERVLGEKKNVRLLSSLENGKEVIAFLERIHKPEDLPELIILDHNMPMMNGTETLGAIKSSDRYSRINVVIYSTYNDQKMADTCRALGASLIVSKPSSMKEYEATIEKLLQVVG